MSKKFKIGAAILLILSALGFCDALYLTVQHYSGEIVPCTVDGCETVLTSPESEIVGVPVALLGCVNYFLIFALTLTSLILRKETLLRGVARFTAVGAVASSYFVYLQLFVIGAICQYCMLSAVVSYLAFITALLILRRRTGTTSNVLI